MSIKESAKTKGYLKNLSSGSIMKFQFNPETFSYSRGVSFSEIISPGMAYPRTQYTHGNAKTFSIDLFFFDKPHTGLIEKKIAFIEKLVPPESNPSKMKKPPSVLVCYGSFIQKCVVENYGVTIEEMNESGGILQATVSLSFRQVGA